MDCNNCLHIAVCDKYQATGGHVRNCKHFATDNNVGSKWIPVSERMPNHFGDFIVAVKEGTGQRYSDYASYDPYQQKWRTGLMLGRMDEVTHWMPLPEPPKEGE